MAKPKQQPTRAGGAHIYMGLVETMLHAMRQVDIRSQLMLGVCVSIVTRSLSLGLGLQASATCERGANHRVFLQTKRLGV